MVYIIKDWAGNEMYPGQVFSSFEEAWDHIMCQAPEDCEDEYFSEYQVTTK